jgi:hypothetical protein
MLIEYIFMPEALTIVSTILRYITMQVFEQPFLIAAPTIPYTILKYITTPMLDCGFLPLLETYIMVLSICLQTDLI